MGFAGGVCIDGNGHQPNSQGQTAILAAGKNGWQRSEVKPPSNLRIASAKSANHAVCHLAVHSAARAKRAIIKMGGPRHQEI